MGARIEAVAIGLPGLFRRGSLALGAKAAQDCLRKAGVNPHDVGIIVHAGIYKDEHIGEPAIAAFLQRRMGANEEFRGGRYSFSFDVSSGGGSLLTALMVVDGFLASGVADRAMVIAGDAEPVPGDSIGYPFSDAAAAVLVGTGRDDEGFRCFRTYTDSRYLGLFQGRMEWRGGKEKRNRLVMREDPAYGDACVQCAVAALGRFQEEMSFDLDDIHLVIPSQSPPGFVACFGERTGLSNRIVDVTADYGNVHTAGIGLAIHHSLGEGKFLAAVNILFVAVGAGITTT
ncbi:MAG: hypothetical protein N2Z74_04495, partial [Syntrophales bacterium]|nr:hypothetical protein [Syntrophales bacterium]